ncbi:hypothetical protein ROZALSC1DRAFT_29716 [Rozella allomycis CSF55]|uniref:Uncharacterized protein n=1 Tax=Rozella allomycis (strain CSF55) TaxID=988480 RepID=A0A4P9YGJ1_ROZAC|nr:hypothetical protein ROZALSC1DRAFT_29716 [Rozella allomycis CSF55]
MKNDPTPATEPLFKPKPNDSTFGAFFNNEDSIDLEMRNPPHPEYIAQMYQEDETIYEPRKESPKPYKLDDPMKSKIPVPKKIPLTIDPRVNAKLQSIKNNENINAINEIHFENNLNCLNSTRRIKNELDRIANEKFTPSKVLKYLNPEDINKIKSETNKVLNFRPHDKIYDCLPARPNSCIAAPKLKSQPIYSSSYQMSLSFKPDFEELLPVGQVYAEVDDTPSKEFLNFAPPEDLYYFDFDSFYAAPDFVQKILNQYIYFLYLHKNHLINEMNKNSPDLSPSHSHF